MLLFLCGSRYSQCFADSASPLLLFIFLKTGTWMWHEFSVLSFSASWVLEFQAHTTMPSLEFVMCSDSAIQKVWKAALHLSKLYCPFPLSRSPLCQACLSYPVLHVCVLVWHMCTCWLVQVGFLLAPCGAQRLNWVISPLGSSFAWSISQALGNT